MCIIIFLSLRHSRFWLLFALFVTFLLVSLRADNQAYPDPSKTPGDAIIHNISDLPQSTKDVRDVPSAEKNAVFDSYNIPQGNRNGTDYEIDHFVPLSLGGSNNQSNLWPQTRDRSFEWNAWEKDKLEFKLYQLVHAGLVPLDEAQNAIKSDWVTAYAKYMPIPIDGRNDFESISANTENFQSLAPAIADLPKAAGREHVHYTLKSIPLGLETALDIDPDALAPNAIAFGDIPPRWLEPQDTTEALLNPDLYAWRLFVALNWPADVKNRRADPVRKFGENDVTVWESWKLSSGKDDEVFLSNGEDPGPWLSGSARSSQRFNDLEALPLQQEIRLRFKIGALFDPNLAQEEANENHMNLAAYTYIEENDLYYLQGQEKLFAKAIALRSDARSQYDSTGTLPDESKYKPKLIDFPPGSKEVKAQWREITEADKPKYRWSEFTDKNGRKRVFGLTALHITTKDLPNWFWATFEHVDNPTRPNAEQWLLASRDSAATAKGYPDGLGIEGTMWENYRLRGTQTNFVDASGHPILLANSEIETGFQTTASCISCHALAAIGPDGTRLSFFPFLSTIPTPATPQSANVISTNGIPDPGLFEVATFKGDLQNSADSTSVVGNPLFLQEDFVWSLARARARP